MIKLGFGQYCLREWQPSDAEAVAHYADNRAIWMNLRDGFPHPYSKVDADHFIQKAREMELPAFFAIATSTEAIGSIGISIRSDIHRHSAELGYWLGEPFWNSGIMTGAVRRICDFAFGDYKLARIHAEPFASNAASIRVLEKAGFEYEGRLRNSAFKNGQLLDQVIYARIRKVENAELQ